MKVTGWLLFGMVVCLHCFSAHAQQADSITYNALKEGFANPPAHARPKVYWWWLNGNVDTMRAKEELRDIKKAGISGVDIFEIGVPQADTMIHAGPSFMGDTSLQMIRFAIAEAAKLKLDVGLNLASSWNAGGSWTLPKNAAKSLYYATIKVKGARKGKIPLPFPEISPKDKSGTPLLAYQDNGKPAYYEDVAVLAMPAHRKGPLDTTQIINLTAHFDPRTQLLDWEAPAGEWDIYRYVCANSGQQLVLPSANSHGLIIDHFDAAATRAHLMYFIHRLQPLLGDFHTSALKSFYLASYEAKGSVWTPSLPVAFKQISGYEVYKFIPALFDPALFDPETRGKFQADFQRTLSELMINNLYKNAKSISNHYGLKINSEAGGPAQPLHNVPVEPLKALGALDIPRGEFWNKYTYYNKDSIDIMRVVKEVAAASHIYHRGIVEEESFTSFRHWQDGPFDLKPFADRAFGEGMNRVVMHGFSHSPSGTGYPGFVYHAGTHFNDKSPWWHMIRPFVDYLGRISYVLQQSDFVSDVLYYYGDTIPNYVAPKNTRFTAGKGYDYEVINTEILLKLTVQDGQLTMPDGSQFKVLALGNMEAVHLKVLEKIRELVEQGALVTGSKPKRALGLSNQPGIDEEIKKMADQWWATTTHARHTEDHKKGKVMAGVPVWKILQEIHLPPDFAYADDSSSWLDYVHFQKDDLDFYLVRNTTDQWISRFLFFRQQNKSPELWDPLSGEVIPIPIYHQDKQHIKVPFTLPPYGASFLVFRKQSAAKDDHHYDDILTSNKHPPFMVYTKYGLQFLVKGTFTLSGPEGLRQVTSHLNVMELKGPWTVTFPKGWGAPDSANFPKLVSWTSSDHKGIKYFSGTATYHKTFQYAGDMAKQEDHRVYLDLGNLSKVAKVWLNGRLLGVTWAVPFRLDVTKDMKVGANTLKIEVANTWSNRLTGDALTGEKYTNTNIKVSSNGIPWARTPLIPSGLLGPVTIQNMSLIH